MNTFEHALRRALVGASLCLLACAVSPEASAGGSTPAPLGCAPTSIVTTADDDGAGSLREAIETVCNEGTITFAAPFQIVLSSQILVDKAVTLDGQIAVSSRGMAATASISGGGVSRVFEVETTGALTLHRLRIRDASTSGRGGAIRNRGMLDIIECSFDGNFAGTEGGLGGGAILNDGGAILTVVGSTFTANTAGRGAALFNGGEAHLLNSTFSANTPRDTEPAGAIIREGAIQNRGTLVATHITVTANGEPGDIGIGGLFGFGGDLSLINSIIADNAGKQCDAFGAVQSLALLSSGTTCAPDVFGDADLSELGDFGGPTATNALGENSVAIDAGDAAFCAELDQRGVARPGGACDLGAFEAQIVIFGDGFE